MTSEAKTKKTAEHAYEVREIETFHVTAVVIFASACYGTLLDISMMNRSQRFYRVSWKTLLVCIT